MMMMMMNTPTKGASSMHPPSPMEPLGCPDLYGKRRQMARIQMMEREISFLEEELKSSERLQPASRCCKEIDDFVIANSDPLLPTRSKKNRGSCRFWKWLCRMRCFNLSWISCWCCCCDGCCANLKLPRCCGCCCCRRCKPCNCSCSCLPCINCSLPKWHCCSDKKSITVM